MPGFDGSGPSGMGPMTGGGRGRCNPTGTLQSYGVGYRRFPLASRFRRALWGLGRGLLGQGGRGQGGSGRGARGRGRW